MNNKRDYKMKKNNRIKTTFESNINKNKITNIIYITAGFPEKNSTEKIVDVAIKSGEDIIEIGIPFSDPLGDGPIIQEAGQIALESGINTSKCLKIAKNIRLSHSEIPLIFMGYYNSLLSYGVENFCSEVQSIGVDGLIIADLPPSESEEMLRITKKYDISLIPLLAITSSDESIRTACKNADGFIYCISSLGVTGVRNTISSRINTLVSKVRKYTDTPVAVGFGISNNEQIMDIAEFSDGIIIGSAVIKSIMNGEKQYASKNVGKFLSEVIK